MIFRMLWWPIGILRLLATMMLILLGGVLLNLRFRSAAEALRQRLIQGWSRQMLAILGIRIDEHGPNPAAQGGLFVANHISFVDILLINATAPSAFVSKDSVASWPLIGSLATKAGTIYLERGSRRAAHRVQELITEGLRQGRRVAIFPEGTTTDGHALLPFHGALFQSAIDAPSSVHCLLIRYLERDGQPSLRPAYISELSMLDVLWQVAAGPGLMARIEWLDSLDAPHPDRRHLAHHAHQRIAHALAQRASGAHPTSHH